MFLLAVGVWLQAHAGIYAGLQANIPGPQQGRGAVSSPAGVPATLPAHTPSDSGPQVGSLIPVTVAAKQFGLAIKTSPETVTVGQRFTVTVRVLVPAMLAKTVKFPAGSDSSQDFTTSFGVMQRQDIARGNLVEMTGTYQFAAWDIGRMRLGLSDMVIGNTHVDLLSSPGVFVRSVLPKDSSARLTAVPKTPRPTFQLMIIVRKIVRHFAQSPQFLFVIVALILAGLAWIVVRYVSKRKEAYARIYWTQWAKREFKRIESLHLLEKGEADRHAILMTTTLRQFLIHQFPTVRASATTRELATALKGETVIPAERTLKIFERVDMLKFAGEHSQVVEARAIGLEDESVVDEVDARRQRAEAAAREAELAAAATKKNAGRKK